MKTTKLLICAISVVAAVTAAKANAQTLNATFVEISPMLPVNGTIDDGSFFQDYPSGVLRFTEFDAFCVEPVESLSYGEALVYQVQDVSLLHNFDTVARLVGGYLASPRDAEHAAAVQWAIWETTTESLSSPSLLSGNVRIAPVSGATATLANQYLANASSYAPANLVYLRNNGRQDVVTWNLVPEPASLTLAGFSALLLLRRRR